MTNDNEKQQFAVQHQDENAAVPDYYTRFRNTLQVQIFYYVLLIVCTVISCITLYFVVSPSFIIHNHYHYFRLSTSHNDSNTSLSLASIFIDENFPSTAFLRPIRRHFSELTTKALQSQANKVDTRPIINPFPYKFVIPNENACAAAIDSYYLQDCAQSFLKSPSSALISVGADDNDSSPCGTGERRPLQAVILIHSSPQAVANRAAIRSSWGAPEAMREFNMRVLFVMGTPRVPLFNATAVLFNNSAALQAIVVNESRQYGDIVQADFVSHYWNNTYSFMSALKWVETFCYHTTKFIVKTDDDFFINLYLLDKYLEKVSKANSTYVAKQEALGQKRQKSTTTLPVDLTLRCVIVSRTAKPVRDRSKWYVSRKTWPTENYPTSCFGGAVIFTPYMAAQLLYEAQRHRFFRLDDIFITGVAAQNVSGLVFDHIPGPGHWIECGTNFMCIVGNRVMFYHTQQNLDIMKKYWGSLKALHKLSSQSGFIS